MIMVEQLLLLDKILKSGTNDGWNIKFTVMSHKSVAHYYTVLSILSSYVVFLYFLFLKNQFLYI